MFVASRSHCKTREFRIGAFVQTCVREAFSNRYQVTMQPQHKINEPLSVPFSDRNRSIDALLCKKSEIIHMLQLVI